MRESLGIIGRCCPQRRISRRVLLDPFDAPVHQMYTSGCNQSMTTLIGFDIDSFNYTLGQFAPLYYVYTPYFKSGLIVKLNTFWMPGGQPHSMTASQALGLVFAWFHTRGSMMSLRLIFGKQNERKVQPADAKIFFYGGSTSCNVVTIDQTGQEYCNIVSHFLSISSNLYVLF